MAGADSGRVTSALGKKINVSYTVVTYTCSDIREEELLHLTFPLPRMTVSISKMLLTQRTASVPETLPSQSHSLMTEIFPSEAANFTVTFHSQ